MPRLSERSVGWLGALAVLALIAHAVLLAPGLEPLRPWLDLAHVRGQVWLALLLGLTGRVVLSFLPPGEVGSHAWSELSTTAAASLALGSVCSLLLPGEDVWPLYWIVPLLALARWATLPGAMVPRHGVPGEPPGALDAVAALAGVAWASTCVLPDLIALEWLALCVLVFHALGVARRRRAGRYVLLALGALLLVPPGAVRVGPVPGLVPAMSLGLGASALVPWLRRADRRAGWLAALGFGSLFAEGPTLLGLAGPVVMLAGSHARQRRFAASALAVGALPFILVALAAGRPEGSRGRLLWLPELVSEAFASSRWGLAWPLVLAALLLGALTFPWRETAWSPGAIEEPRREAKALVALLALAGGALALPGSPWAEVDVPLILFPPASLLAGLLLLPSERVRVPG